MAETDVKRVTWCSICESCSLEVLAHVWCPECEQGLCAVCSTHHGRNRLTKGHTVITIDAYHCLPAFVKNAKSFCEQHDEKCEFFCSDHVELCCSACIIHGHQNCASVFTVKFILKDFDKTMVISDYNKSLKDLSDFIDETQKERKESLSSFEESKQKCLRQINESKNKVNSYFDALENKLIAEISDHQSHYLSLVDDMLAKLETQKLKVESMLGSLNVMQKYASDFQTFLALTTVDQNISDNKASLIEITEEQPLKCVEFVGNPQINSLENLLWSLGEIITSPRTSDVTLGTWKGKHAQILSVVSDRSKSLQNLKTKPLMKMLFAKKLHESNIVGCVALPDGRMLFADYSDNRRVMVYNSDGTLIEEIKMNGKPCCMAILSPTRVLVTLQNEDHLEILNLETSGPGYTVEILNHDTAAIGIALLGDRILTQIDDNINEFDFHGNLRRTTYLRENCLHLAVYEKHILLAQDNMSSFMLCFSFKGDFQWKFSSPHIRTIEGITTDTVGNMFVSGFNSNNVVIISKDRQQSHIILSEKDGIRKPTGLFYIPGKEQLLVCCARESATLYQIQWL